MRIEKKYKIPYLFYLYCFTFRWHHGQNFVIVFLVELNIFNVVKDIQQMSLEKDSFTSILNY